MTHYAGIDVSLETSSLCIVDAQGAIQREFKLESEPEVMVAALLGTGFAFSRIGLEAGPLSQWLHAGLARASLPVVLLETRQLRATTKAPPVKTDRNDARAMAQVVSTGWYKAVQVKSELSQGWRPEAVNRALLTRRKLLVAKLRDLDNGIRGLLRGFGLKVGQVSEAAFPTRVRELTDAHAGLEALMACAAPRSPSPASWPSCCTGCGVTAPSSAGAGRWLRRSPPAPFHRTSTRSPVAGTRRDEVTTASVPAAAEPA
jgi:transposase